jgi:hypothetical protein
LAKAKRAPRPGPLHEHFQPVSHDPDEDLKAMLGERRYAELSEVLRDKRLDRFGVKWALRYGLTRAQSFSVAENWRESMRQLEGAHRRQCQSLLRQLSSYLDLLDAIPFVEDGDKRIGLALRDQLTGLCATLTTCPTSSATGVIPAGRSAIAARGSRRAWPSGRRESCWS